MKERSIVFSTDDIRAIRERRKRSSAVRRDSLCPSGASLVSTIRRPFGCCPEIRVAETVTLSRIRSI